jgi:hypothetical protein
LYLDVMVHPLSAECRRQERKDEEYEDIRAATHDSRSYRRTCGHMSNHNGLLGGRSPLDLRAEAVGLFVQDTVPLRALVLRRVCSARARKELREKEE